MSGVQDSGDERPTVPDVVVIGSTHDAAISPPLDAGPERPVQPRQDASSPPRIPEGPALPSVDAGGTVGDASAPVSDPGVPDAASPSEPLDGGRVVPPSEVDAGTTPPVDAGPLPGGDAGRVGCLPGTYKGTFDGEISALLGLIRIDVAGTMSIDVELSGSGDRLTFRNGVLQGTDTSDQKNPLFARISGVLDCASKKLENGIISDGTYNRIDPIWGGPPMTTTFAGTAMGTYSTRPPASVGTWTVKSANGARTSMGTFNVTLQ